jgi:hypothetical protein
MNISSELEMLGVEHLLSGDSCTYDIADYDGDYVGHIEPFFDGCVVQVSCIYDCNDEICVMGYFPTVGEAHKFAADQTRYRETIIAGSVERLRATI